MVVRQSAVSDAQTPSRGLNLCSAGCCWKTSILDSAAVEDLGSLSASSLPPGFSCVTSAHQANADERTGFGTFLLQIAALVP